MPQYHEIEPKLAGNHKKQANPSFPYLEMLTQENEILSRLAPKSEAANETENSEGMNKDEL